MKPASETSDGDTSYLQLAFNNDTHPSSLLLFSGREVDVSSFGCFSFDKDVQSATAIHPTYSQFTIDKGVGGSSENDLL